MGSEMCIRDSIICAVILSRIDDLDEDVLNLLGWQFHVENWDLIESVEQKREAIKKSIVIHKKKGTPAAVKDAVQTLWPQIRAKLIEWFQYNGDPYKFKAEAEIFDLIELGIDELYDKIIEVINEWKNERSWLDELKLYLITESPNPYIGLTAHSSEKIDLYPYTIDVLSQGDYGYGAITTQSSELGSIYPLG